MHLKTTCAEFLDNPRVRPPERTSSRTDAALSRRSVGGHPYVSRGPRPAMCNLPLRHVGAVGPTIFSDVTTPSPTAAAILARICACTIRSWVAHAVDSASTVSTPSRSDGWIRVFGDLVADHGRPLPEDGAFCDSGRPAPAACRVHGRRSERLRVARVRPRARPGAAASATSGHPLRRRRAAAADVLALTAGGAAGLLQRAAHQIHPPQMRQVVGRPSARRRSPRTPSSDHLRYSTRVVVAHSDLDSLGIPIRRNVIVHRGGDKNLFGRRGDAHQRTPSRGIEFGEDVVE